MPPFAIFFLASATIALILFSMCSSLRSRHHKKSKFETAKRKNDNHAVRIREEKRGRHDSVDPGRKYCSFVTLLESRVFPLTFYLGWRSIPGALRWLFERQSASTPTLKRQLYSLPFSSFRKSSSSWKILNAATLFLFKSYFVLCFCCCW